MTESFLHYIWKFKLFTKNNLKTSNGEEVQIIKGGEHNTNAGPDFFNAKIKIGDTLWAGNVEIHIKSSNWNEHKHQFDAAYNNTILHVSFEHDTEVVNHLGITIPAIELKTLIDPKVIAQYHSLQKSYEFIPCEKSLSSFLADRQANLQKDNSSQKPSSLSAIGGEGWGEAFWFDRMLIERLERKATEIKQLLLHTNNNWEETLYISLARNFGFHINADAFEMLAKSIPLAAIQKHKNEITQIEALLFGQAGLLKEEYTDHYTRILSREHHVLSAKFNLKPLDHSVWKFLRLRPSNFPTIRIAQFAQLLHKKDNLFSEIIEAENVNTLLNLLTASVSDYWNRHYLFDRMVKYSQKSLGTASAELIIINTIAPFLFVYGQQKHKDTYKDKALKLLEQLKPEKNSIIENWEQLGVKVDNAYQSQALLQLKNEYCSHKKCLSCSIGNLLFK
jgi:hypothetical protein